MLFNVITLLANFFILMELPHSPLISFCVDHVAWVAYATGLFSLVLKVVYCRPIILRCPFYIKL